jgi:lysophospholipase L1-like esterase
MQHKREQPETISPRFMVAVLEVLAFLGTLGLHHLICVGSVLGLLYLPMALFAGRWFFPMLSLFGLGVAAAAPWIASELPFVFLGGQVAIVGFLLVSDRLVVKRITGGIRGKLFQWTGRGIRTAYLVVACFLLLRMLVFRGTPIFTSIAWAVTVLAFVWKAPWPAPRVHTTWRQKVGNVALLAATIVVCVAGLEIAARALFPPPAMKQPARAGFEAHPEALWTFRPGRSDTYTTVPKAGEPHEFVVSVSEQGLRERQMQPKEPDEFRILALGDSLTMGWGVAVEDAYPRALEERLAELAPERRITVINAGVAGYGPWQERIFLLERCLALQPDLVVLQVYPENDVHNTLNRTGEYLESYNPEWEEMVRYWRYHADWRMQAEWWLLSNCRLYSQFQIATGTSWDLTTLLRHVRFLPPLRIPELPPIRPRPFYLEFMLEDWYPKLEEAWALMQQDVLQIRDDCVPRDIAFLAFCLPSWIQLSDEEWSNAVAESSEDAAYERFKDVRVCETFFEEADISYANVTETLLENGPPERLYMNDGHLTPEGNRVLAERLAGALVDEIRLK